MLVADAALDGGDASICSCLFAVAPKASTVTFAKLGQKTHSLV